MPSKRLNIVSSDSKDPSEMRAFSPRTNRDEVQATFEKLWHRHPEKFHPMNNCMGRERIARTLQMIDQHSPVQGKMAVDLGSGSGVLTCELKKRGASITAVDIANNALENLRKIDPDITLKNDCVPHTKFEDESFDTVICTDLIAYLKPKEHRLLFSELSRLVKKDGFVICSTPIDINSEDALERFTDLVETELSIEKWKASYHRYYIRLLDFLKAPARFAHARKDQSYREQALAKRFYLAKWWFRVNSAPVLGEVWGMIQWIAHPLYKAANQNRPLMIVLEKACRFFSSESGITHVILIAKRRPLVEAPEFPPVERKQKKTVWE